MMLWRIDLMTPSKTPGSYQHNQTCDSLPLSLSNDEIRVRLAASHSASAVNLCLAAEDDINCWCSAYHSRHVTDTACGRIMSIIESSDDTSQMHDCPKNSKHMKELVRIAPNIECTRSPALWYASLIVLAMLQNHLHRE